MMDYITWIIDPAVRKHCGPLLFANSMDVPKGNILNNGTFALVNTGRKRLLVTCCHVWDQFKQLQTEHPDLKFCVCASLKQPWALHKIDSMWVDDDRKCDLVTFDIGCLESECAACGLNFFNIQENPPPKLSEGDTIYLIGFPGKGREDNEDSVGFPRQAIAVNATQVGQFSFLADLSKRKMETSFFAGISGAPCFACSANRPIKLVGFATGFAPNSLGMLQFTYASFIQPDGIIRYMS